MRRRLLAVWYGLLSLMVVELAAYGITGFIAGHYHKLVWEKFNAGVRECRAVDSKIPYAQYINRYARQAGISPEIAASVIQAESSFQPRALSKSGAYGLMQVIPETWRQINRDLKVCSGRHAGECTVECYYNPELNIRIGTAYLGQLYTEFKGDMTLALAAYNAGPGAVARYRGIPPYGETIAYVAMVVNYWHKIANKPVPDYGVKAERFDTIQTALGWWLLLTLSLTIVVGWRLLKCCGSWRWR